MKHQRWVGAVTVLVPIGFSWAFTELSNRFQYPEVLRQPADQVLSKFDAMSQSILPFWWMMFLSAVAFVPVSLALPKYLNLSAAETNMSVGTGVAAGLVQAIGLSRWIFLVPFLAKASLDSTQRPSAILIFESVHRWAGMGIGEWLGYAFTTLWTLAVSASIFRIRKILGVFGIISGLGIAFGCLEIFGGPLASISATINSLAYLMWSGWIVTLGALVFLDRVTPQPKNQTL